MTVTRTVGLAQQDSDLTQFIISIKANGAAYSIGTGNLLDDVIAQITKNNAIGSTPGALVVTSTQNINYSANADGGSNGFTTIVQPKTGEGLSSSNPLIYDGTKGAAITSSSGIDPVVGCSVANLTIQGIQIQQTGTNYFSVVTADKANFVLDSCIVDCSGGDGGAVKIDVTGGNNPTIQNCLIVYRGGGGGAAPSAINLNNGGASAFLYGNTLYSSLGNAQGFHSAYGTGVVLRNNAFINFTTDVQATGTPYTVAQGNNATTAAAFNNANVTGQTSVVAATEFTSGTADFRLVSGSVKLKNNGATIGPADDIFGVGRPQGSAYDIGASEFVQGGGGPTNIYFDVIF